MRSPPVVNQLAFLHPREWTRRSRATRVAKNEDDLPGSSETCASPFASQTSAYEKGPNGSCAIRPGFVSYCFASGDGPTNESHLLAVVCTNQQLRRRGERDVPASERALREAPRPQKITGIIQT